MAKMIPRSCIAAFLLLAGLWAGNTLQAATIQAGVDRNPVNLGDSFQITFTADAAPDGDPDFSPLEEDFEILSQGSSNSLSLINGKMTRSIRWTLNVMARHAGKLEVPPVRFGKDISQPLSLLVNDQGSNDAVSHAEDIFIQVEATPENPYIQSQILYTVRIYTRVEIARATIDDPEQPDAVVEKLGDDRNFQTQVNGVDYMVTERRYAVFPQKSGTITFKPLVLTAEVIADARPSFNGFFGSRATRTKRVSSKAVSLSVKPVPASFTGKHWLSAERLDLKESWSSDLQGLKVGEPVTRTLSLEAKGSTVGQLPELHREIPNASVKTYPDQPVLQELKNPDGLTAKREEKIALIPSKPGTYKLPGIEIPWFNTLTGQMEVAKIPETVIEVGGGAPVSIPESGQSAKPGAEPVRLPPAENNPQPAKANLWIWVSLGLAAGWLATVIFFLRRGNVDRNRSKAEAETFEQTPNAYRGQLKKACAANDPVAAKNALLEWGQECFSAKSLGETAAHCEARLRDEILRLNKALYSREGAQWESGRALYQAFSEHKVRARWTQAKDEALEPLFRL